MMAGIKRIETFFLMNLQIHFIMVEDEIDQKKKDITENISMKNLKWLEMDCFFCN